MSDYSEGNPLRVEMTPEQAFALFERLVDDEEFRRRYADSPAEVLREHGLFVDERLIPSDVAPPDPEAVRALLDEVRRLLEGDHESVLWGFWWLGLGFAAIVGFKNLPAGFGPHSPKFPPAK